MKPVGQLQQPTAFQLDLRQVQVVQSPSLVHCSVSPGPQLQHGGEPMFLQVRVVAAGQLQVLQSSGSLHTGCTAVVFVQTGAGLFLPQLQLPFFHCGLPLSQLAERGPMTFAQLQKAASRSQAATSHLVEQLEQRGLVQRKPDNWADNPYLAEKKMVRNPADLIGKKVYVKYESAFKDRLENLSQELGGDIIIVEDSATAETESLIREVAEGRIKYTVTDQMIAMVNAAYYPNIDISTMVSLPQRIAWALRKNSPDLLAAINNWLDEVKRDGTFNVIYNRYFNSPRTSALRKKSDFSSLGGNKVSVYDDIIKAKAKELGWDWRLLASMIYQESNFSPTAESWAGARGLMQLVPSTGKYYGARDLFDPVQNINAGVNFLKFLDRQWGKTIEDKEERIKFMLASYNVGLSHVLDARNLAIKYGGDPTQWEGEVEAFLLKKSDPKFYRDPVVKSGYCRCQEPVDYVREVLQRFVEYKKYIN